MKKLILLFSLCLLFFPFLVFGAGTIQVINFSGQVNAMVGHQLSAYINFAYSGNFHSGVSASITGTVLPPGLQISSVTQREDGVDYVRIYGNPETSGNYNLTMVITDNNGALLTQSFNLLISPNNFILPNATVNQSYSQYIPFDYTGDLDIIFSVWQNGIKTSDIEIKGTSTSLYEKRGRLDLTPHKAGQFIIRADLLNSGSAWGSSVRATNAMDKPGSAKNIDLWKEAINPVYSQTFYLTVINSTTTAPVNPPTTVQQPPVANKQPVSQATDTPTVEKIITEELDQSEVDAQNNEEQNLSNDAFSPADDSNQKKAGFFQPVSNFFKNIFRSIGSFFINISK